MRSCKNVILPPKNPAPQLFWKNLDLKNKSIPIKGWMAKDIIRNLTFLIYKNIFDFTINNMIYLIFIIVI